MQPINLCPSQQNGCIPFKKFQGASGPVNIHVVPVSSNNLTCSSGTTGYTGYDTDGYTANAFQVAFCAPANATTQDLKDQAASAWINLSNSRQAPRVQCGQPPTASGYPGTCLYYPVDSTLNFVGEALANPVVKL